jgi:hypothetical protein
MKNKYIKLDVEDNVTIVDKELIDHIQDGIVNCEIGQQWEGKQWLAIGTSLTSPQQGTWANPLAELSGMVLKNRAVPGAVFGGHILYYAQNAAELKTASLITVEGAVNDFAGARPLGEVGDTVPYHYAFTSPVWDNGGDDETGTFAGACYQVFKSLREKAPQAVIVVLTDPIGRTVPSTGAKYNRDVRNKHDKLQMDYNKMIKDIAEYFSLIVIDTAVISGICQENPEYYVDHLHHSEIGGKMFANAVWSHLKNIPVKIKE